MVITSVMMTCSYCGSVNWLSRNSNDTVCNVCGKKLKVGGVQSTSYGVVFQKGVVDDNLIDYKDN